MGAGCECKRRQEKNIQVPFILQEWTMPMAAKAMMAKQCSGAGPAPNLMVANCWIYEPNYTSDTWAAEKRDYGLMTFSLKGGPLPHYRSQRRCRIQYRIRHLLPGCEYTHAYYHQRYAAFCKLFSYRSYRVEQLEDHFTHGRFPAARR